MYGAAPSVAGDKVSKRSEDQVASHQLPPQHVSMNDGHFYPMQKGGSFKGEYASQMGRNHMMLKKAGSFIHTPSRAGSNNVNMKYSGGHGHQKRSDSFSSATTSNRTSDPDSIFYGSYVDSSSYSSATGEYMVQMGISPDMSAGMMYHSAAPPTQQSAAGAALSAGSVGVAYSPSRRNNNMTSRGGAGRGARGIVDGDV